MSGNPANNLSRRTFLVRSSLLAAAAAWPVPGWNAQLLPRRSIPGTDESLPIIGLGSTKAVMQLADAGTAGLEAVLKTLLEAGGSVVDTWSRDPAQDALVGEILRKNNWLNALFLATKVDTDGATAGRAMIDANEHNFGKAADLIQVFSMRDIGNQWPLLREMKDQGRTRYIGITAASESAHGDMLQFMKKEHPDFIQVNYSLAESNAEREILPYARDHGIAAIINRPFMNGDYFPKVQGHALPAWAAEFDCASWAQFALKFILANPAVTCVLTETTRPEHLLDNLTAAQGGMPNAPVRARMQEVLRALP